MIAGKSRYLVALALLAAAVALPWFLPPSLFMFLWFLLSLGVGLVLARWWALLLGAVPWPLSLGVGFAAGRFDYLGDGWWQIGICSMLLPGLVGLFLGVFLVQSRELARLLPFVDD